MEKNAIGGEKTISRVVNICGFRGDAIKFDYFEILALLKITERRCANIKSTKVEPIEASGQAIDCLLHCTSLNVTSIKKNTSAAMRSDFNQLHRLVLFGNIQKPLLQFAKVNASHAYRPVVFQNQLLKRVLTITNHRREQLLCD